MRKVFVIMILALGLARAGAAEPIQITSATTVRFASLAESRALLGAPDTFTAAMSPYDRAARLKTDREVSEAEFLEFAASCARPWGEAERRKMANAFQMIVPTLNEWRLPLPPDILLIKTSGAEESGNFAYSRGHAIVIPAEWVASKSWSTRWLSRVLVHELYYIMTRHDPALRARLFATFGFEPCDPIEPPEKLKAVKITPPDMPRLDYCATFKKDGKPITVIPILYSRAPKFQPAPYATYATTMMMSLLELEKKEGRWQVRMADGQPVMFSASRVAEYYYRLGKIEHRILQPEEIVACHFEAMLDDLIPPTPAPQDPAARAAALREQSLKTTIAPDAISGATYTVDSTMSVLGRMKLKMDVIEAMRRILEK